MRKIYFNCSSLENRIAIVEDERLVELYYDRPEEHKLVGNVYRGRVVKVLPGIQAAFVDLGLSKTGYLYIDDVIPAQLGTSQKQNIRHYVHEGQEILVQISKEGIGSKGPRVTTHIAIPGRYLIYTPMTNHIAISRKIRQAEEQVRLRDLAKQICSKNEGMVVRTQADGIQFEELEADYLMLKNNWQDSLEQSKEEKIPTLIFQEEELFDKILRDYLDDQVDKIYIDDSLMFRKAQKIVHQINPNWIKRVEKYQGQENLFSYFQLETAIHKALQRNVPLPSGGFIVIDQTEALTSIDVNTGKFVGNENQAQTIFKTNQEAAREIPHQLRLRNIGGIILIDFIDMHLEQHKEAILSTLEQELKKDRLPSRVFGITKLGLVEMTRKKVRKNLLETLTDQCMLCKASGKLLSMETLLADFERKVMEYSPLEKEAVLIEINQHVYKHIKIKNEWIDHCEQALDSKIYLTVGEGVPLHHFELILEGTEEDVKKRVSLTDYS